MEVVKAEDGLVLYIRNLAVIEKGPQVKIKETDFHSIRKKCKCPAFEFRLFHFVHTLLRPSLAYESKQFKTEMGGT